MSKMKDQGVRDETSRRILLAASIAATIKIGVMGVWLGLYNPLGIAEAIWAALIYICVYLTLSRLGRCRQSAERQRR